MQAALISSAAPSPPPVGPPPPHYRFLRCCTLPRQRKRPLTMMAILVHSASHSSMLPGWGGRCEAHSRDLHPTRAVPPHPCWEPTCGM